MYGIDEFFEENKQLYLDNRQEFYTNLLDHLFSDHEIPCGQDFFENFLFTPLKENSKDFGELDGLAEESEIRKVVNGTNLEFMCICYSYGFPGQYFICLTDPDQENPTVYGIDHGVFSRNRQ